MLCSTLHICITLLILGFSSSQQHSPISEESVINRTKQDGQTLCTNDYHFRYKNLLHLILQHNSFIAVLRLFYTCKKQFYTKFTFSDGSKKGVPFLRGRSDTEELSISTQTETHLVSLLNQLCSRLMEKDNAKLLDVFFHASQNLPSGDQSNTGNHFNSL